MPVDCVLFRRVVEVGDMTSRERDGDAFLPCPALPALPACLLASFAYLLDKKNSVEIEMAKVR